MPKDLKICEVCGERDNEDCKFCKKRAYARAHRKTYYAEKIKGVPELMEKHRTESKKRMQRLRERRTAQGLNSRGERFARVPPMAPGTVAGQEVNVHWLAGTVGRFVSRMGLDNPEVSSHACMLWSRRFAEELRKFGTDCRLVLCQRRVQVPDQESCAPCWRGVDPREIVHVVIRTGKWAVDVTASQFGEGNVVYPFENLPGEWESVSDVAIESLTAREAAALSAPIWRAVSSYLANGKERELAGSH